MTKPTIDDFIKNPSEAVRKGYKPDFMGVGALAASMFSLDELISIKKSFISVMRGEVIELPKNLIRFILTTFFVLFMPICLPFWWGVGYFIWCKNYKNAQESDARLDKLL